MVFVVTMVENPVVDALPEYAVVKTLVFGVD